MTAALEGGEWSAAHPSRTLPPGKTRYPLYRRLGGPQGWLVRVENLASPGYFLKKQVFNCHIGCCYDSVTFPAIQVKINLNTYSLIAQSKWHTFLQSCHTPALIGGDTRITPSLRTNSIGMIRLVVLYTSSYVSSSISIVVTVSSASQDSCLLD